MAAAGAVPPAPARDTSRPVVRIRRPSRSRMNRVSLWKTGMPSIACSARSMRSPLLRFTLSPQEADRREVRGRQPVERGVRLEKPADDGGAAQARRRRRQGAARVAHQLGAARERRDRGGRPRQVAPQRRPGRRWPVAASSRRPPAANGPVAGATGCAVRPNSGCRSWPSALLPCLRAPGSGARCASIGRRSPVISSTTTVAARPWRTRRDRMDMR